MFLEKRIPRTGEGLVTGQKKWIFVRMLSLFFFWDTSLLLGRFHGGSRIHLPPPFLLLCKTNSLYLCTSIHICRRRRTYTNILAFISAYVHTYTHTRARAHTTLSLRSLSIGLPVSHSPVSCILCLSQVYLQSKLAVLSAKPPYRLC